MVVEQLRTWLEQWFDGSIVVHLAAIKLVRIDLRAKARTEENIRNEQRACTMDGTEQGASESEWNRRNDQRGAIEGQPDARHVAFVALANTTPKLITDSNGARRDVNKI